MREGITRLLDRLKNARAAYRLGFSITDLDNLLERAVSGEPSHAGVDVSGDTALNFSATFCAVNIIAGTIASLPLILYRRTGEDGKERYSDHPLYTVLHNQPNPEMTSYVFRETLQGHLLLWGNAFAEIRRDKVGRTAELWPINPAAVKVKRDEDKRIYYEVEEEPGRVRVLPAADMLHIPGMGFDGRVGYSVVTKAREALGLGLAMEEFQSRFYGHGTNVGGVLEHPGHLSDQAHIRLKKDMDEKHGGLAKSHSVLVLEEGMKYTKTAMPLEDAQFLESRTFQIGEIARWFNLPPHKLKELSKATYSNIEQQQIEFVMDSIRPWAVRWEQHIAWKLLGEEERRRLFAEFLIDGLLRGDSKSRNEAYAVMRQNGVINADEWRGLENMNPIGGRAGEMYWKPLNMGDADSEDAIEPPAAAPPTEGAGEGKNEEKSLRAVK